MTYVLLSKAIKIFDTKVHEISVGLVSVGDKLQKTHAHVHALN